MLASMTGFGRAVVDAPFGKLIAEIQSVNRKYLEVIVSLPKEFGRFEHDMRKWIGEKISRGQISLRIYLLSTPSAAAALLPDPETLRGFKVGWEKISESLGYDSSMIDLPFLMQNSPIQQKVHFAEDADLSALEKCLKEALDGLLHMKFNEGKALGADVSQRLSAMAENLIGIEDAAPEAAKRMREKLIEKLAELQQGGPELDERILREVILYAERIDISEEITRLKSHFDQFHQILNPKKGEAIGRKMDFLIQEIGREINTIASKSAEAKISHRAVEMKSELEKIREQIQNIE